MFMYATLDPQVFEAEHFGGVGYFEQADAFLRAVMENACVLVDEKGMLRADITKKLESLPRQHKQYLLTMWTEISKPDRHRIIDTCVSAISGLDKESSHSVAQAICDTYSADGLITTSHDYSVIHPETDGNRSVIPLHAYSRSEFERRRREMLLGSPPLDEISPQEASDLIYRCTCFSKWLILYDQFLGTADHSETIQSYLLTIEWILRIWSQSVFVSQQKNRSVTIYTRFDGDRDRLDRLKKDLFAPLKKEFNVNFKVHLKRVTDPTARNLIHSRYLQSSTTVLMLDYGFNIIDSKTHTLKPVEVKCSDKSKSKLQKWKGLPDFGDAISI